MMAIFKKPTFVLLLFASQYHLLQGIPNLLPGENVRASQTRSTSLISRSDDYYNSFYNNYPFYQPYYQVPNFPWHSRPYRSPAHGPSSGSAHQLPSLIRHPQIPNVVSHPHGSVTGGDDMIRIFLNEHNKVRNSYGAPELVWNPGLVPAAKRVTDTCTFKHTVNNQYGENIAAGQPSPQQVVMQWVNGPEEKSAWDPNAPRDSHFTQVVWHGTREVGCAVTSCSTLVGASLPQSPIQFWACEYHPAGNVETLYLKNVHAAAGGAPLQS